ncbi:MAG: GNVR domain-containing protein [Candidatus Cloacimonetes bacterium]|nr:GNVR domain-containing protein [Candidatus Cloacimonadota bacterium]MDD4100248.1 GNVR domain-containing protein [Candidatus Cloacimonadota bacterium]
MLSEKNYPDEKPIYPFVVIDIQVLFKALSKKLKNLLVITVIAMAIAALWALIRINPTWKADCYVIRAPKNMSTPADMPYLYQSFDINTILETVRTRDVLTDVIKKLELDISPESLFRNIDVQRGNRSSVLRFSARWSDPEMAANIANATAESFIYNNTKLQNSATLKIYNYYLEQQKMRLETIDDLSMKYEAHRAKYGIISIPHETQGRFELLKTIEIDMAENALMIKEMETKIDEMQGNIDEVPEEVVMNWTYNQTDETKLLELEKELETLLARYTDDNPKVIKLRAEIGELQAQIEQKEKRDIPNVVTWGPSALKEVYSIDKARFLAEKEAALKKNAEFEKQIADIRASLENLTSIQKDFFEIERQLETNKDVLKLVEGRLAEAKMAMQSNVSDVEILESARAPRNPESGRRKLIVLLTGIIVFVFGASYLIVKELLSPATKSEKDFTDAIRIPLVANLPDENSVATQVFYRNLQVMLDNIQRGTAGLPKPVITLGNDVQETGKSFIANELIQIICQKERKVLYIDTVKNLPEGNESFVINDFLYEKSDSFVIDTRHRLVHHAFFHAGDDTFTTVLDTERVQLFISKLDDYDFIFWELFEFSYNIQLFSSIALASDLLLLVARFERSNRNSMIRLVSFLQERKFHKIYGVLNYVHKDYFQDIY